MINQLFQTVLFSTISGSVLILLLLFLSPIMSRKIPAKWRYYLWIPVLLQLIIIVPLAPSVPNQVTSGVVQFADNVTNQKPVFLQKEKQKSSSNDEKTAIADTNSANVNIETPEADKIDITQMANDILNLLPLIWFTGFLASFFLTLLGYLQFLKRIKSNKITSELFQTICTELKIRRKVSIKTSPNVSTPMLLGVVFPTVIIPEQEYSENELRNILVHELMHQKKLDVSVKWAVAFVRSIHWFNPLVYLMSKSINQACELGLYTGLIH